MKLIKSSAVDNDLLILAIRPIISTGIFEMMASLRTHSVCPWTLGIAAGESSWRFSCTSRREQNGHFRRSYSSPFGCPAGLKEECVLLEQHSGSLYYQVSVVSAE